MLCPGEKLRLLRNRWASCHKCKALARLKALARSESGSSGSGSCGSVLFADFDMVWARAPLAHAKKLKEHGTTILQCGTGLLGVLLAHLQANSTA